MFAKDAADHFFVAAGAGQSAFQGAASAGGVIIDEAGDLVGHYEWQIGMRGLDFGFGFCLDVLVDGWSKLVGFVDGRGLGLLLGKAVALLQGCEFQAVDSIQKAVEFVLEAVVGAEIESAA